ncbi:HigA family addiction module antitoxin [Leptospira yasudae]|uniref:Addiction module antidote protein, HigA family n=1 Tax=Leptospira yasudae TaxID=2202201 RepID=A0ABX9LXX7_9LEPT|nr:HigA family addiction module antitoxin [Leptospira yasudae]RHX77722.1 addiction module antidote protein, HigA family [Leptospira yasudae]TGK25522.1 addiction module antidote protein, HigA family [Leptospira yasudae]TGM02621.1 addiction module antidote protein, HigA family [Leptospira yasudae]TGN01831.1 addiction module antidote protein, HigA family [Leptospira yasudae]
MKVRRTSLNPHPGDVLKYDFLEPMSLSAYRLSKDIGISESLISQIINRKKSITPDTALRLARYFKMTPDFWLNYQMAFDLEELERTKQKEYNKIKPTTLKVG